MLTFLRIKPNKYNGPLLMAHRDSMSIYFQPFEQCVLHEITCQNASVYSVSSIMSHSINLV